MKTKIWVGVLFYSFMGCANKAPKSKGKAVKVKYTVPVAFKLNLNSATL